MTDVQLERGIAEFLKARHIPGVQCVEVRAKDGVATIRGTVNSAFAKWSCYECCRHVTGVRRVIDEVQVSAA